MGRLKVVNDNMYQKISTAADFNRQLGVLKDTIIEVSISQATSGIVPTGFRYLMGTHELEVYVNGNLKRRNETIESGTFGDYLEYSNFSIMFEADQIDPGDIVRFRVTTANYKIVNTIWAGNFDPTIIAQLQLDVASLNATNITNVSNIQQIGRDVFGYNYSFGANAEGSTRTIGVMTDFDTTPNLANYRVWKTSDNGAVITDFDGCKSEDIRHIIFQNTNTTISNNENIILSKNADIIGSDNKLITLIFNGSVWIESSSSAATKCSDTLSGADWILDGTTGLYYGDVDISSILNTDLLITCYNNTTNQVIQPENIQKISNSILRVWMIDNTVNVRVVVSE